MKGIDVYTGTGNIDWGKVVAGGYEFAMVKATQGRGEGTLTKHLRKFTDSKFKKNIVSASDAGLALGTYHYMTARSEKEAREEAEYFCKAIAPYRDRILLWAAVDVESTPYLGDLDKWTLAKAAREFMNTVRANGFKPMLYTNPNYLKYKLPTGEFDRDEIWLAHYGVKKPMSVPNTRIWQYDAGTVPGVKVDCDRNVGYFSPALPAIARLHKKGVINTPLYWAEHYDDLEYLPELIIKSESKIIKAGAPCKTLTEALGRLSAVGAVNTPAYWEIGAYKVDFLPEFICKLGGSV